MNKDIKNIKEYKKAMSEWINFFKIRNETSDIILKHLKTPSRVEIIENEDGVIYKFLDYYHDFAKVKGWSSYNPKEYETEDGQIFISFEKRPKTGYMREILGIPFRLSGVDYSYPFWRRRVTWSHWSGALTDKQKLLVLNKIREGIKK